MTHEPIEIRGAPVIPGLRFRHFRGASDIPPMAAAIAASADADQVERVTTVKDIAHAYTHLTNCDPYQDMILAEINSEVMGIHAAGGLPKKPAPTSMRLSAFLSQLGAGRGLVR